MFLLVNLKQYVIRVRRIVLDSFITHSTNKESKSNEKISKQASKWTMIKENQQDSGTKQPNNLTTNQENNAEYKQINQIF